MTSSDRPPSRPSRRRVLKALTGLIAAPKLLTFASEALAAPLVLAQAMPRTPDPAYLRMLDRIKNILVIYMETVSYTHLTLPTIYSV